MEERLKELSRVFGGTNMSDGQKIAAGIIAEIFPIKDARINDIEKIISEVNEDRLSNYPLKLNTQDLENILSQIIE